MMKIETVFLLALLFVGCVSTRTVADVDRVEEVQRAVQLAEATATEALHSEQSEWVRYTEVVEKISEAVEQPVTARDRIIPTEEPKHAPREPPKRTIERTTRTIEGAQRSVEAVINHSTLDTLSTAEQIAVEEQITLDEERESNVSKSLRWLAVIAICIVAVYLLNFLKKFKR